MKRTTLGVIVIVILGMMMIGAYKLLSPYLTERGRMAASDAKDTQTIRIGGDTYLGYWFITSPDMRKRCAQTGIAIEFTNDEGAYADRESKFKREEYDIIALPTSSYIKHGAKDDYSGVIGAAIAESVGADGIVGFANKFPQGKVSELNDPGLRGVYVSDSPSSFLLDLTITSFDLFNLASSNSWRVEVSGMDEVKKRIKKHDGDFFVMWEPDLSRALAENPELKRLWGSEKFRGYIVDDFVFSTTFVRKNEALVMKFLENYFTTLRGYANDRSRLVEEMSKSTGLSLEDTKKSLDTIDWFDLHENAALQFGIQTSVGAQTTDGIINTIVACTDVLLRTKEFQSDPLKGNPYRITNKSFVERLVKSAPAYVGPAAKATDFEPMEDAGWRKLRDVGILRQEPITFQTGMNALDDAGKESVDKIATMLVNNYPQYRVAVRGHTGPGDEAENKKLSQERAEYVVQRLIAVHGIDPDRLHAEGLGSSRPPEKRPNESPRAFGYRQPRVEFVLLESRL